MCLKFSKSKPLEWYFWLNNKTVVNCMCFYYLNVWLIWGIILECMLCSSWQHSENLLSITDKWQKPPTCKNLNIWNICPLNVIDNGGWTICKMCEMSVFIYVLLSYNYEWLHPIYRHTVIYNPFFEQIKPHFGNFLLAITYGLSSYLYICSIGY